MSPNLSLPYLEPGQAQKHVTLNESLQRLDAVVQLSVVSATLAAEPGAPTDGAVYILPTGKTGASWSAYGDHCLASYRDGAWEQITPREGWIAWVKDTDLLQVYTGAAWSQATLRTALAASGLTANTFSGTQTVAAGAHPSVDLQSTSSGAAASSGSALTTVVSRIASTGGMAMDVGYDGGQFWLQGRSRTNYSSAAWLNLCPTGGLVLRGPSVVFDGGQHNLPGVDNAYNLGSGSYRFNTVFASSGTINTSDAREKTALREISDTERRAIRRVIASIGLFQWKPSISKKGEAAARLHAGVTAQAIADAFAAEGLDASRYGLFCADAVVERRIAPADVEDASSRLLETPAKDPDGQPLMRYGVRYDQLFAMALAVLFET